MKKCFCAIICIVFVLSGCTGKDIDSNSSTISESATNPTHTSNQDIQPLVPVTSIIDYPKSYEELAQLFREYNTIGSDKLIEMGYTVSFVSLVQKVNEQNELMIPALNGEPAPLEPDAKYVRISVHNDDQYDYPWIWYHCIINDQLIRICVTSLDICDIENYESMSVAEIVKTLNPKATDPGKESSTKYVSEVTLSVNGSAQKVLVYEWKNNGDIWVFLRVDDLLIYLRCYSLDVLTEGWTNDLSFISLPLPEINETMDAPETTENADLVE